MQLHGLLLSLAAVLAQGGGSSAPKLSFLRRPPAYDIAEIGATLSYECGGAGELDSTWDLPRSVRRLLLGARNSSRVYVTGNNTLVIESLRRQFRGTYTCVLTDGNVTIRASMTLHVLQPSSLDFVLRFITGISTSLLFVVFVGTIVVAYKFYSTRRKAYIKCRQHEVL